MKPLNDARVPQRNGDVKASDVTQGWEEIGRVMLSAWDRLVNLLPVEGGRVGETLSTIALLDGDGRLLVLPPHANSAWIPLLSQKLIGDPSITEGSPQTVRYRDMRETIGCGTAIAAASPLLIDGTEIWSVVMAVSSIQEEEKPLGEDIVTNLSGVLTLACESTIRLIRNQLEWLVSTHGLSTLNEAFVMNRERGESQLARVLAEALPGKARAYCLVPGDHPAIIGVQVGVENAQIDVEVDNIPSEGPDSIRLSRHMLRGFFTGALQQALNLDSSSLPGLQEHLLISIAAADDDRGGSRQLGLAVWEASLLATLLQLALARLLFGLRTLQAPGGVLWTTLCGDAAGQTELKCTVWDAALTGGGASSGRDGQDGVAAGALGPVDVGDVEDLDALLVDAGIHARSLRQSSAGAGKHRGGHGTTVVIGPLHDEAILDVAWVHAFIPGLYGGHGGLPNSVSVANNGSGYLATGEYEFVAPSQARVTVRKGSSLVLASAGGPGWGDPVDRFPELVLSDVRAGLLSEEEAKDTYGVVVLGKGAVDLGATDAVRKEIYSRRLSIGKPAGHEEHS